MWALSASVALAIPPRAEVFASVSGDADASQGLLSVQTALLRSDDASLGVRASTSALQHAPADADLRMGLLGASLGPSFTYGRGDVSVGMAMGLWARLEGVTVGGERAADLRVDASLSAQAYWRPAQRAQLYAITTFDAAALYLWGSVGGTVPMLATHAGRPVGLWIGAEATSGGTFADRGAPTMGPVVEVPIRDLRTVIGLRAGLPTSGDGPVVGGTRLGVSVYWWY